MAEKARNSHLIFRPHFKSHQSVAIGEWFREEGVKSITVSSVGMAHYFAEAGWNDITIAFPVNQREIHEIDHLASQVHLNLLVSSLPSLRALSENLTNPAGIFIEIDTGYHRSGLTVEDADLIKLLVEACNGDRLLSFSGFLSHFGESYHALNVQEIKQVYDHGVRELYQIRAFHQGGVNGIISVGDTPSCSVLDLFPGVDEIRPGNFVFYDVMQLYSRACKTDQIALCLAVPVVDINPSRDEAVVYGGAIHLSKERIFMDGEEMFGLVVHLTDEGWSDPLEGCLVTQLSQEHGVLRLDTTTLKSLQPGSLIGILPVHACLTADAMKRYTTLDGNTVSMFSGIK